MFFGLLNQLPWWNYVVIAFLLTHVTAISITIFLHRTQAHRALELHPIVSHFFRFWLWLTTGMETKAWTAIHRKHHSKCETEEDPHSPQILGIDTVLWQGVELYRKESKNKETLERFGQGTPNDWLENNLYTKHSGLGIIIMLIVNLVLLGLPGISIWAIQMLWTPFFAAGIINGVGHYWGYRNFECKDASRNIIPFGFFIAGEELHNNHHTFGTSAKFSVKPWEFDIGWMYIKLFSLFGLAKAKRLPPKLHTDPAKTQVDIESVKAIITNRFQVLSEYSKSVIQPVFNDLSKRKTKQLKALPRLNQLKKLMQKEDSILKAEKKKQLKFALEHNETLKVIYQFKEKLQAIWEKTTANQRELLDALQDWCKQAESTRIQALRDFAASIKTYTVIPST